MTPTTALAVTAIAARNALAAACMMGAASLPVSQAHAISASVRLACAADYFSYCSQYSPGSSEVRQCMRANGTSLSKRCINALVAAGEVSADEVARRSAAR